MDGLPHGAKLLQQPCLADLDKGEHETCFQWYIRCNKAAMDGNDLALQHKAGDFPFLKMYGTVDSSTFTPFSPLRFPIQRGFITELIHILKRAGRDVYADPFKDASLLFHGAPLNVDGTFRSISTTVDKCTRKACPPSRPSSGLAALAGMLSSRLAQGTRRRQAV